MDDISRKNTQFEHRQEGIRKKTTELQNEIHINITSSTANIVSSLQIALAKLFQLTVFIRGDFDSRPDDVAQKTNLLNELNADCEAVHRLTEDSLQQLGNLHVKGIDLRQLQVIPLIEDIRVFAQEIQTSMSSVNDQINSTQNALQNQEVVHQNATESFKKLSSDLAEAEALCTVVDVGVSLLVPIWGIITAIDNTKRPSSIGPLRDSVQHAREAVDDARKTYINTQNALMQLNNQHQGLKTTQRIQQSIAIELRAQSANVDAVIARIDTIEQGLIAAKKSTTEAVRRSGQLSNAALITAHMSISKKDFAEGIMDISEVLVMDSRSAYSIRPILAELKNEYGGSGMPKELLDRLDAINANIGKLLPQ